jgi:hypothetical protein
MKHVFLYRKGEALLKNSERIVGTFIYLNTIPGIADVSK